MPRPKKYFERRITTAVRLPESVHRKLSQTADAREVSLNQIMVRAIERHLEHLGEQEHIAG